MQAALSRASTTKPTRLIWVMSVTRRRSNRRSPGGACGVCRIAHRHEKLKVSGVNVVALGERDPRPSDEVIAALDSGGCYKRAIARNGILVGAQVVGDAKAAAAFARV